MLPRRLGVVLVVILLLPLLPVPASPASPVTLAGASSPALPEPVPALRDAVRDGGSTQVLVALRLDAGIPDLLEIAHRLVATGARDIVLLEHALALSAVVDEDGLAALEAEPRVEALGAAPTLGLLQGAAASPNAPWSLTNTSVTSIHPRGIKGQGTVVAIVDSGVRKADPNLGERHLAGGWWDAEARAGPFDECGHGTAVASVVVDPQIGVAPAASWIAARIVTASSNCNPLIERALDAWDWILSLAENGSALAPDVVVNSWGYVENPELEEHFRGEAAHVIFLRFLAKFKSEDILPVFAAGNDDQSASVHVPADYAEALAVGMVNEARIANGARGPGLHAPGGARLDAATSQQVKPDLLAPGDGVPVRTLAGTYGTVSGTSFAAPFVAGVALLVKSQHPAMKPDDLRKVLLAASNLRRWTPEGDETGRPNNEAGFGVIDAQRALELAERARRVLLVGDYDQLYESLLTGKGYDVVSLRNDQIREAFRRLPSFGTLMLANLDDERTAETTALLSEARQQGTGVVLLGDPGRADNRYDGVQAYVAMLRAGQHTVTERPWTHTGDLQGTVQVDRSPLLPEKLTGNSVPVRRNLPTGTEVEAWTFGASAGVTEALRPTGRTGVMFATRDATAAGGHRVAILGNAGGSGNNIGTLTQESKDAILDGVEWARADLIDPLSVPADVSILHHDVIVVGDPTGQIADIARGLGLTAGSIPSWDLQSLRDTLYAESGYRDAQQDSRVRLIVYNEVQPAEETPTGRVTIDDVELVRWPSRDAVKVPVLVLGGPGTRAIELLGSKVEYAAPVEESATSVRILAPHWLNGYGASQSTVLLDQKPRSFTLATPDKWALAYTTADGKPVGSAYFDEANWNGQSLPHVYDDRRVVLGMGAGVDGKPLGEHERDAVEGAIAWAVMKTVTLTRPLTLDGDAIITQTLPVETWGDVTYHVLNALDVRGPVTIRNAGVNVLVTNSHFHNDGQNDGLVLENVRGRVEIMGNRFEQLRDAIVVKDSPDVHIHYNTFAENQWALAAPGIVPATPNPANGSAAEGILVDATFNHFSQINVTSLARFNGISADKLSGWAVSFVSSAVCATEACPNGLKNGIDPAFWVLPAYTKPDYSETFPCVDIRPAPVLQWLRRPPQLNAVPYLEGPVVNATDEAWTECWALSSTDVTLSTANGNQFIMTTAGNLPIPSRPVEAAAGLTAQALTLPPGSYSVATQSLVGRGHFDAWEAREAAMPYVPFTQASFASSAPASWTLSDGAARSADAGRDGLGGVLRVPADASASFPLNADLYGLDTVLHVKPAAGTAARLRIESPGEALWPILSLGVTPQGVESAAWILGGEAGPLAPGSWHKIEIRMAPPRAEIYVDNVFAGAALLATAPPGPGVEIPLKVSLSVSSGTLDVDDVLAFRGEALSGYLKSLNFDDGSGGELETSSGGGSGGGGAVAVLGRPTNTYNMQAQSEPATAAPAAGSDVRVLTGDEGAIDTTGYAVSDGDAAYGSGSSVYLESADEGTDASLRLLGGLRHYQITEYVAIPAGQTFKDFSLLRILDEANQTILDVRLEDNNAWLDVAGARTLANVARIEPRVWHKLSVVVSEEEFTLRLDDRAILTERVHHVAGAGRWFGGGGTGSMMVDNLEFGHFALLDEEVSDSASIDASWLVTRTGSGNVTPVTQVPVPAIPGDAYDDPLLASRTLRILAPALEAGAHYVERALPPAGLAAQAVHVAFYLPEKKPLTPANDAMHVFRLDDQNGPLYSLVYESGDTLVAKRWPRAGSTTPVSTAVAAELGARQRWHEVVAVILPTGEIQVNIDNVAVTGLSAAQAGGARPTKLLVGDTTSTNDPLRAGQTGSGEVYVDDVAVWRWNRPPQVWIDSPTASSTIGGNHRAFGRAQDPDEHDAVAWVNVTLTTSLNAVVAGPFRANGTTSWEHVLNTTGHAYGSYKLVAKASDGRAGSQATVSFTINNRPVVAIGSPASGASIGGIVNVTGTAVPRFPLQPGEEVDTLEYRIDSGTWIPLEVRNGAWSFSWNTSGYSKGYHWVYVRAAKWRDSTTLSANYYVDNSPEVAVASPTAGSEIGGDVTFTGMARDRYVTYPGDTVDSLQFRIDSGPWMVGNVTPRAGGWADWTIRIDTHTLAKGAHGITVLGTEDGHQRSVTHSFSVNNTPILGVIAPEPGSSFDSSIYLRAYAVDRFPSPEHPYPTAVYVETLASTTDLILEPNETVPGRVEAWRNVGILAPGERSFTYRAYDGVDSAATTFSATMETGENISLRSGVARFAVLIGPQDHDTYRITVPADATQLNVTFRSFEKVSGSKIYLKLDGDASPTSYDHVSTGDGTFEAIRLTTLTGLTPGTYSVWVQSHDLDPEFGVLENSGDYRLQATLTRLGGGGILG